MTRDRKRAPAPEVRGRRPHHIANIAHHFFSEDEEANPRRSGGGVFNLVVSGPRHGFLTARASVALATHLLPEGLLLLEDEARDWSLASHLPGDAWQELPADEAPVAVRQAHGREVRFWRPAGQTETPLDHALALHNLGVLNNRQLTRLEAAAASLPWLRGSLGSCDVLVWCLGTSAGLEMGAGYTLGRAVQLLRPRAVEVLLLREGGDAGGAGDRTAGGQEWEHQGESLFKSACPDTPVQVSTLALGGAMPDEGRHWLALGRRIGRLAGHLSD